VSAAEEGLPDYDRKGRPRGKPGYDPHDRNRLTLVPASDIAPRPTHWLWDGYVPIGALTLLAGREGLGKTTVAYERAAKVTRGKLDGVYKGTPKSVIIAATEDSWDRTIVPRLMAAKADLTRVFQVKVADDEYAALSLPDNVEDLEEKVGEVDAALVLLDPLMSRLGASLDSHKDGEVRQALEPVVRVADRTGAAVLGIIHVNKSESGDALNRIMGSRAFGAVARSVLYAMKMPEDPSVRVLGLSKSNLGQEDADTLTFRIEGVKVADTDEGEVTAGRLKWLGPTERGIDELLDDADGGAKRVTTVGKAVEWLASYLMGCGGSCDVPEILKAAENLGGYNKRTVQRAAEKLKVTSETTNTFPSLTVWTLPEAG
jgi:AAA domain-containing protein